MSKKDVAVCSGSVGALKYNHHHQMWIAKHIQTATLMQLSKSPNGQSPATLTVSFAWAETVDINEAQYDDGVVCTMVTGIEVFELPVRSRSFCGCEVQLKSAF